MPLYQYICEGGHRFEEVHSIAERNNVNCPGCKGAVHIRISLQGKPLVAHTFTTYGHDGRIIGQKQTTDRTAMKLRTKSGKIVNA